MFLPQEQRENPPSRENDENTLDEASKLMLAAADLIEKRGLPDCALDGEGRGCVIVTLGELGGMVADDAMERLRKNGIRSIADWSDEAGATGRTAEVVAKLRAVALGL